MSELIRLVEVVDSQSVDSLPNPPARRMSADMAMYAAIAGKIPTIDPDAQPLSIAIPPRPQKAWSPLVLSLYLRDVYRQSSLKLVKPEIAAWIRRQSMVARKRISETQVRLASLRNDRAA